MSNFLELVKAEREKQINKHGYTPEHDDEHTDGSIADAAACYASQTYIWKDDSSGDGSVAPVWPWDMVFLKKDEKSRKEQLITAAALINAEYDRIVREEKKQNGEENEIPQH